MPARSEQVALALLAASAADEPGAIRLARRLDLPSLAPGTDPVFCTQAAAVLLVSGSALCLQQTGKGAPGPITVDFGSPGMRHRRLSGSRELLGKAVGVGKRSPLRVLDATAGLGRDAFVLADLGCEVALCERDPVIVELLASGMHLAAASGDPWLTEVAQRLRLLPGDVRQVAASDLQGIDVIYLDPMFPQRTKSAAVKKEMALLQSLLKRASVAGDETEDANALLRWALAQDTARVVVKRPAKAPDLAALQPSHRIRGKAVRYDVYVHRKLL